VIWRTRSAFQEKGLGYALHDVARSGAPRRGTRNIFMAVEPLAGHRETAVTVRRTKADFVHFVCGLLDGAYRHVTKLHLVLDNLNTHFRRSFERVLGDKATSVLRRIELHHTPKHACRLNLAELELGIMERQCTRRRLSSAESLATQLRAWQQQRNDAAACLHWSLTRQDADRKLGRHYVAYFMCYYTSRPIASHLT
jgi:hypothetical protein